MCKCRVVERENTRRISYVRLEPNRNAVFSVRAAWLSLATLLSSLSRVATDGARVVSTD